MKKLTLIAALCALTTGLVAADDTTNANMRIRFINAIPGGSPVTLSVGSTPLFSSVRFGQVTSWKPLSQEQKSTIQMNTADGRRIETDKEFKFDDNDDDYTIVAMAPREGGSPYVKVFDEDRKTPDATKAFLTIINTSLSVKSARVEIDGAKFEAGINYADSESQEEIAAGNHSVRVIDKGNEDSVVGNKTLDAAGGKSYTAVIIGPKEFEIVDDSAPDNSGKPGAMTLDQTTETQSLNDSANPNVAQPSDTTSPTLELDMSTTGSM